MSDGKTNTFSSIPSAPDCSIFFAKSIHSESETQLMDAIIGIFTFSLASLIKSRYLSTSAMRV